MYWTKRSELIEQLLEQRISNRDCDKKLYANVIFMEAQKKGYDPHLMSLYDFLTEFTKGDTFSSPESIRRTRQKIQETNPKLRGEKYEQRHKQQAEVKKEFGY